MKEIKKTFMAGVLACAALNINDAKAEMSPFGYGLKASASSSSAVGYSSGSAKINSNGVTNKHFENLFVSGQLYGEYAATDYIGFGAGAGYLKQGATLEEAQQAGATGSKSTISLSTHGIVVPLYLCIYPLGREEEGTGIFKVNVGASGYFPFSSTYKKDGQELSNVAKEKKAGLDIAATAALEYELPFGLSIEAKYGYGFLNRFNNKEDSKEIFSVVSGLENLNTQYMTLGLGYNFAALLSE